MKDINKIFIFFFLLALTSCNKKQQTFTLKVVIKDFYTQSVIPNKTINLYAVQSNFGLMPSDIIETQTTDSQGQATFFNVPVNTGKVSYRIQTPQSIDYSSSEYIKLEKNSELVLFLYPLVTKKIIVNKPASISKYNVLVSSDFFNNDGVFDNTSTTNSYFFKFVPSCNNQILIGMITTLNTNNDTIINISPTQSDTSTININL
jgi:hypothetical protein